MTMRTASITAVIFVIIWIALIIFGTVSAQDETEVEVEVVKPATDQKCPRHCTFNYKLVCGQNAEGYRKQYSNECMLRMDNCKRAPEKQFVFFKEGRC